MTDGYTGTPVKDIGTYPSLNTSMFQVEYGVGLPGEAEKEGAGVGSAIFSVMPSLLLRKE